MTITEFAELTRRLQVAEETLLQCQKTICEIKERMKQISGELKPQNTNKDSLQNPFPDHTPYFDMVGETFKK